MKIILDKIYSNKSSWYFVLDSMKLIWLSYSYYYSAGEWCGPWLSYLVYVDLLYIINIPLLVAVEINVKWNFY